MSPGSETAITNSGDTQKEDGIVNQTSKGVVQVVTIPSLVSTCLSSFERMLASIIEKEPELSHEITSSEVSDTIGRFRVWSSNIGAHKTGRSSLEYRLRDASHIRERAQALLQSLIDFIEDGTSIVKGEKTAWDKLRPDTHSDPTSTDSESSDSSSDGSLDNETELHQVMISINARITLLMRLSMAIRTPASHDRLLNSANIDISHFEEWDIRHVRERFPDAEEEVVRRLGSAISRRRQYFKYRSNHAKSLAHEPMSKDDGRTEYQTQSTIASSLPEAIKNNPHLINLEEEEDPDAAVSQTSFATSTGDDAEGPRVPPLPKRANLEAPFECPFCFMLVSIRTRKSWKRHVYKDLHPYVCTFPGCPVAHKVFEGRREWFQHERGTHRRYWICQQNCFQRFSTQHAFRDHIMNEHNIRESVEAFVESSERTPGIETRADCCLCGENCVSLLQLRNHLGDHQRQLALFALPPLHSEDHDNDDDADVRTNGSSADHSSVGSESLEELDLGEDRPFVHRPSLSQDRFRPFIHQHSGSSEDEVPTELRKASSSPAHQSPRPESYAVDKEFSISDLNLEQQGYASPGSNDKAPMPARDERTHHDALAGDKRESKIHDELNKVEAYLAGMSANYSAVVDGLRTNPARSRASPNAVPIRTISHPQHSLNKDCNDPDCCDVPPSPGRPPFGYHHPSIETRIPGSTRPERPHSYYNTSSLSERHDYLDSATSHGPPPSMYNNPQYATMMAPSPHAGYYGGLPPPSPRSASFDNRSLMLSRASDGFMPRPPATGLPNPRYGLGLAAPSYPQAPVSDGSDDDDEDEHGYYPSAADRDRMIMPPPLPRPQPAVEPSRQRPSFRSPTTINLPLSRSVSAAGTTGRRDASADVNKVEAYLAGMNRNYSVSLEKDEIDKKPEERGRKRSV